MEKAINILNQTIPGKNINNIPDSIEKIASITININKPPVSNIDKVWKKM